MYPLSLSRSTSSPQPRKSLTKTQPIPQGFSYPQDKEEALSLIWESFKKHTLNQAPSSIFKTRSNTVYLMMQCHKLLKLPIETLYLSVSVFDQVLALSQLKGLLFPDGELVQIGFLGVACLYSCQKLEKIRNYGVSYWVKNITQQFTSSIGFPTLILTLENIKKYEFYIMQATSYNLLSTTVFDILMALWTLSPPSQVEFYLSHYFLELSILSELKPTRDQLAKSIFHNTASSLTDKMEMLESEGLESGCDYPIYGLEVALAIMGLAAHFGNGKTAAVSKLIKTLWPELAQQQNGKQYQKKQWQIESYSNQIFEKALESPNDPTCQTIILKYSKQVNFAISKHRFQYIPPQSVSLQQPPPQQQLNYGSRGSPYEKNADFSANKSWNVIESASFYK